MSVHPDCEKKFEEKKAIALAKQMRYAEREKLIISLICPDCSGDLIEKTGFFGFISGYRKHVCSDCGTKHTYFIPYIPYI